MSRSKEEGARLAARLAARTAHDLNNIAAVFSGHLYLLRNAAEPSEEGYEAMEKALADLERLTRSLTALGAVGVDEASTVDLNDVVREASRSISGPVDLTLVPTRLPILGRPRDLQLAVEALLGNAREAAGPGPPIRVLTRVDEDSAVLTVEDTGPGVAPAVRQRNFDPLFSTKGEKGRGVGLALASLVATLHGGELAVEDRAEGGTRASLRLRLA